MPVLVFGLSTNLCLKHSVPKLCLDERRPFFGPSPKQAFGVSPHPRKALTAGIQRSSNTVRTLKHSTRASNMNQSISDSSQAYGWGSPNWKWGYAVGDAHDAAAKVRSQLRAPAVRAGWLQAVTCDPKRVSWFEIKLVLALAWQRAARDDGGPNGFRAVMENMRLAQYEGNDEADAKLVQDMDVRLPMLVDGGDLSGVQGIVQDLGGSSALKLQQTDVVEFRRRYVAAQVLILLEFVEVGL
eukprot:CAMPEP_0114227554 /NCGR_PEP_ID=MMETSP0058-20121206/1854_1 /TAXON_ID=36894 /ORGANISM="Pyramimonas parkeae, CCMP726" /LENGTH=240 /DNA_ID=CAMNT_0001338407 /DNA_START=27 /DNA_END=750 /DNA_ORIENTATION=-